MCYFINKVRPEQSLNCKTEVIVFELCIGRNNKNSFHTKRKHLHMTSNVVDALYTYDTYQHVIVYNKKVKMLNY